VSWSLWSLSVENIEYKTPTTHQSNCCSLGFGVDPPPIVMIGFIFDAELWPMHFFVEEKKAKSGGGAITGAQKVRDFVCLKFGAFFQDQRIVRFLKNMRF